MIRSEKKTPAKLFVRVLALVMALLMFGSLAVSAATIEDVPYYSYCYWEGPSRYQAIPMRAMYEAEVEIDADSLGLDTALVNPQFLALSQDKTEVYILDSGNLSQGNSRIVVFDAQTYELIREIGEIQSDEGPLNYRGAKGLYVDKDKKIYIADTENRRVLITDEYGNLLQTMVKPNDFGVPEDLEFQPTRVIKDNKDYTYVACLGCYYGVLVYDTEMNFLGFHGSYVVQQTVVDTIKGWVTNLFMTNDKAERSRKKLPAEVLDIAIDSDGMLYTLSSGSYGQIKRMGLNGNQTLAHKFGFTSQSGDLVNFSENPAAYWHKHDQYVTSLTSISVDPEGFIYIMDQNRGRIFMYDQECRAISVFSGGFGAGDQVGTFSTPQSFVAAGDRIYVMDFKRNLVTVLKLTEYGRMVKDADLLTMHGEYLEAQDMWHQVLQLDGNNQRAYEGIGKAMLTTANAEKKANGIDGAREYYNQAMKYAELGNDQQTYSQAYEVMQKDWISRNFWWLFILCLVAVAGVAGLLVLSKKRKIFEIKNVKVKTALNVPIHPFQAFNALKYQKTGSLGIAALIILLFYLASVSEDLYGGFMYVITDTANYNAIYTLIGTVGLILLWVIVNWGICILNEGKGSLKEVFIMSAYSITPMIVNSLIFTVASHVIPATGTSSFALLGTIMTIYTVLLLLLGMTVVHEYSFFKAMWMAVVCVAGMLLAAFVIFSVILLAQQFILFFVGLFQEAVLR